MLCLTSSLSAAAMRSAVAMFWPGTAALVGLCGGEVQGLTVRSPGPLVGEVLLELLEGEDGKV